ncbi:carnitine dehydratase [Mesorhizobium loti]|nr:CaiB/BaiF CoA-transferase family protein [Mesorhizobium loti]PLP56655.1 carnitine dehydratase [Mesorhizobium loti]
MQDDLRGLTVVAIEQAVAAPYATCRLADAGARVIKIERPDGGDFARHYDRLVEGQSAYFVWLNRGKESVCLNLKSPDDVALLRTMILSADIFIQNLKPGSLDRLGFGSNALREQNPRLITCDITGFGTTGPRAGLKAYDLIVQAESGLAAITGTPEGPARVGVSVCDIAAGMTAHAAILQAVVGVHRTGKGRAIQVSLFDSIADWMNVPILQFLYGGHNSVRAGVAHPSIAPYGAFRCRDGANIIFSIQNEREWLLLCDRFLERSEFASDPRFLDNTRRVANRAELDELIAEHFSTLDGEDAVRLLDSSGIAYGHLNELHEAAAHPHLRFVQVATEQGEIRVIAPAAIANDALFDARPVPSLGQHTETVRREFTATVPA